MESVKTLIAVIAGMTFSLVFAVLVEELIFGKVFGLFFARPVMQGKSGQER